MLGSLWDIATSYWTLGIAGGLGTIALIAALLVLGPAVVLPVLGKAIAALLRCRPCLVVLAIAAAGYGGALIASNIEADRCDARVAQRLEAQRQAAANAAHDRDVEIAGQLGSKYQPEISRLQQLVGDLKTKVADHAKRKTVAAARGNASPGNSCRLGDAALRVRAQHR